MRKWLALLLPGLICLGATDAPSPPVAKSVYILPIRDEIATPMVFLARRGVKSAMEAGADLLVVDMNTDGGSAGAALEIMQILSEFPGRSVTYVNKKAFSAGAFIAVATGQIYMAPQSVIGAAAPIMATPGGGAKDIEGTMEIKMTSALSALVRAQAEKNGYNVEVIQAMVDKTKELQIDGRVLNKEGNILTLTDVQASERYGEPPQPLLSSGTVESLDLLLDQLGFGGAKTLRVQRTGAEELGVWLLRLGPFLLIVGIAGVYIEIKTPGFGLPGIIGIVAFSLYFFGGYAAGLSGLEWLVVFILGLGLVLLELFIFPGTIVVGLAGAALMLAALILALVDLYPNPGPGLPALPSFKVDPFTLPLRTMLIALVGSACVIWLASRLLPKTGLYRTIVSHSISGGQTDLAQEGRKQRHLGRTGVTTCPLHPSGKARFGEELLDVVSQGDFIPANTPIRVVDFNGNDPVVEKA